MRRRIVKILCFVIFLVGMLLMLLFGTQGNEKAAYITAVVTFVGTAFCTYLLRCPHCGRWPGKHDFFAEYCPRCGEPLDE